MLHIAARRHRATVVPARADRREQATRSCFGKGPARRSANPRWSRTRGDVIRPRRVRSAATRRPARTPTSLASAVKTGDRRPVNAPAATDRAVGGGSEGRRFASVALPPFPMANRRPPAANRIAISSAFAGDRLSRTHEGLPLQRHALGHLGPARKRQILQERPRVLGFPFDERIEEVAVLSHVSPHHPRASTSHRGPPWRREPDPRARRSREQSVSTVVVPPG